MRFDISKYSFIGILILLLMSCKDENNQIDEVLYIKTYLSLPSSTLDASEGSFYINVESNSDWKIVLQEGADYETYNSKRDLQRTGEIPGPGDYCRRLGTKRS